MRKPAPSKKVSAKRLRASIFMPPKTGGFAHGGSMKLIALAFTAILALSSCAGSTAKMNSQETRKVSSTGIHTCIAKEGPACPAKIMWHCPVGFEDACNRDFSGNHKCVPRVGPNCRARIAWKCDEGFTNACDLGTGKNHQCVEADTALGGASCAQEIMLVCPTGFRDSCMSEE